MPDSPDSADAPETSDLLGGLVDELRALRRRVDDQDATIDTLRARLAAAAGSGTGLTPVDDGDRDRLGPDTHRPDDPRRGGDGVSRRRLFGAAAGALGGAALLGRAAPAAAADGAPVLLGIDNESTTTTGIRRTSTADPRAAILRLDTNDPVGGVPLHTSGLEIDLDGRGDGIKITHNGPSDAVTGTGAGIEVTMTSESTVEPGVGVTSSGRNNAVLGAVVNQSQGLAGVKGTTNGIGFGVHGQAFFGDELTASNTTGAAVFGETNSSNTAVLGDNNGPGGTGVLGRARSSTGTAVALRAEQSGLGAAAVVEILKASSSATALSATTAGDGTAVSATSAGGIGVVAQGGAAPLRLVPPGTTQSGPPTTGAHLLGEVFCDSDGALFTCVVSGTPGTWAPLNLGGGTTGGGGGGGGAPPDVRAFGLQLLGTPRRAFDSRVGATRVPLGNGPAPKGILAVPNHRRVVDLTVAGGVPDDSPAAVVNVTVTETQRDGFVSIYAAGNRSRPDTSTINWFGPGQNLANTTVVALTDGKVRVFAGNPTHLVLDVIGYYL